VNAETLDRLALEAIRRIVYFINRSAGQHARAMRETWRKSK